MLTAALALSSAAQHAFHLILTTAFKVGSTIPHVLQIRKLRQTEITSPKLQSY